MPRKKKALNTGCCQNQYFSPPLGDTTESKTIMNTCFKESKVGNKNIIGLEKQKKTKRNKVGIEKINVDHNK